MPMTIADLQQLGTGWANRLKRVRGTRGRGRNQTTYPAVELFNDYGDSINLDISLTNGGGEDESQVACECESHCRSHYIKQNNIIEREVLAKGLHIAPPKKPKVRTGSASREEVEAKLKNEVVRRVLDAVSKEKIAGNI